APPAPAGPADPYRPLAPRAAALEPGEPHLYSYFIATYARRPWSLLPPRLPGWYPDHLRFDLHLTDRRLILEPFEPRVWEKVLVTGMCALVKYLSPINSFLQAPAKKEYEAGIKAMEEMKGRFLAVPYAEVKGVETFRWGLGSLVRLSFRGANADPKTFVPSSPHKTFGWACADAFA